MHFLIIFEDSYHDYYSFSVLKEGVLSVKLFYKGI